MPTPPGKVGSVRRGREAAFENTAAAVHVSDAATPKEVPPATSQLPLRFDSRLNSRAAAAPPQRPRTSGGSSSRKQVEKWQTRDDLHFNPLTAHSTSYHDFPLPPPFPRSASSSKPAVTPQPILRQPSRVTRLKEPEPEPEPVYIQSNISQAEIGMALGSPTQQPQGWGSSIPSERDTMVSPDSDTPEWKDPTLIPKRKPSKWKLFGRFGRKPDPSPTTAFYQLQPSTTVQEPEPTTTSPPAPAEKQRRRAKTISDKNRDKDAAGLKRSKTAPLNFAFESKDACVVAHAPEIRLEGGPLLNVDIPNVEMERYSVMFGSLLMQPSPKASSLLARRQATLDRLKTVNAAIAEHERNEGEARLKLLRNRRITSPQPSPSPSFSLFPPSPAARPHHEGITSPPQRSNLRHRSHTAPAELSPNRQTFFETPRIPDSSHPMNITCNPPVYHLPVQLKSPAPTLNLDEPYSPCSSTDEIHDPTPLRPRVPSPTWEMLPVRTSPAQQTSSAQRTARKPQPAISSVLDGSSVPSVPAVLVSKTARSDSGVSLSKAEEAAAKEEALMRSAAEMSIARQISISRRQRHLLVPVKARAQGLLVTVGNEKKPRVPKLVNVERDGEGAGESGEYRPTHGRAHRHGSHRKSERAVVESA